MDGKITFKLKNAPIVEAVLDIECDLPPGKEIALMQESAQKIFGGQYPKSRAVLLQEHLIEIDPKAQPVRPGKNSLHGFQFLHEDEKQLVQVRSNGFSFNRLAPYNTLDDYIDEIHRTWTQFAGLFLPVKIRLIRLRYINRILLPISKGRVELDEFFKICPKLPDEKLEFIGFFNQHSAIEIASGNQVNIILAAQPQEKNMFPVIFDITTASVVNLESGDWDKMLEIIQSLRSLKNTVFGNTLTDKCIELFQQ